MIAKKIAEALAEVFTADASKLPAYTGVALPSGDYAIYRVDRVTAAADAGDAARRASLEQSVARQLAGIEFDGYLSDLRRRSKVEVMPPYAELIDKRNAAPKAAGTPATSGS